MGAKLEIYTFWC